MKMAGGFLAVLLISIISCSQSNKNSILLNGQEHTGEWDNSSVKTYTRNNVEIKVQSDKQFIYIAIKDADTNHTGFDLFFDNFRDPLFMLHISSAHGMKQFVDNGWVDRRWGYQAMWSSNIIQSFYEDGVQKTPAPELFEYQISRSVIPGDSLLLNGRFKRPDKWIVEPVDSTSSESWILIAD